MDEIFSSAENLFHPKQRIKRRFESKKCEGRRRGETF
jgi:hypothetical protein